jgi:hypothetical protein
VFILQCQKVQGPGWLNELGEAGVPRENHRPWESNWKTLSLAAASRVHRFLSFTKPNANPGRIGDRLV